MPKGKPYKKRARNYKKKYGKRPTGALLKIQRPLTNRQPRSVYMNLIKDYQVYVDPKNDLNSNQNGIVITFAVNSLYPFLTKSSIGREAIVKNSQAVVNFEESITPYDIDIPNPSGATIMPGMYEQGNYSQGRKYERAYISGAKLTCWTTGVDFPNQNDGQQAGLLTMMAHNTGVSPFGLTSSNRELKLLSPRVTRRVEPIINSNQFVSNTKAKQTQLSLGVSVKRLNHLTDINDDLENYGFSLGGPTDTGTTSTATIPKERSYISVNYCPALGAAMTGTATQAPPCVMRFRLQQRIVLVEQRSHQQTAGINWNLPKPQSSGFNYGGLAAVMGGLYSTANRNRR